jgi:Fe-S-cluster containining protein
MTSAPSGTAGDPHLALYERSRDEAEHAARARLDRGGDARLGEELAAAAIAVLDRALADSPQRDAYACRAGCGWCCHQPVYVTSAEAIALVSHLLATWPREHLAALRPLLKERINQRIAMGGDRGVLLKGLPCAFLDEENACSVHAGRPLACRGHLSTSASACAERFADPGATPPPIDPHAHHAARGTIHGLDRALRGAGLSAGLRELHRAVLDLLPPDGHT